MARKEERTAYASNDSNVKISEDKIRHLFGDSVHVSQSSEQKDRSTCNLPNVDQCNLASNVYFEKQPENRKTMQDFVSMLWGSSSKRDDCYQSIQEEKIKNEMFNQLIKTPSEICCDDRAICEETRTESKTTNKASQKDKSLTVRYEDLSLSDRSPLQSTHNDVTVKCLTDETSVHQNKNMEEKVTRNVPTTFDRGNDLTMAMTMHADRKQQNKALVDNIINPQTVPSAKLYTNTSCSNMPYSKEDKKSYPKEGINAIHNVEGHDVWEIRQKNQGERLERDFRSKLSLTDSKGPKTERTEHVSNQLNLQQIMETFDRRFPDEDNETSLYNTAIREGTKWKSKDSFDELKKFCSSNGFEMKDSSSNGNCMFQAVNDQLKINGDFRFTISSLRQDAVQYLIDNPVHCNGTHLECFLEETWTTYLSRMAQSCQWGDHLVLQALCEILKRKFVVFHVGVYKSLTEYELTPTNIDTDKDETLHLGHIGEHHYLSLRPKTWEETWMCKAKRNKQLYQKNSIEYSFSRDPCCIDTISGVPLPHLSFLMRQLIHRTDIFRLQIPSKLYSQWEGNDILIAGGKSDGTDVFLRLCSDRDQVGEYWQRFDEGYPLMVMYPIHYNVVFEKKDEMCLENEILAEMDKTAPGYCLLRQYGSKQRYLTALGVRTPDNVHVDHSKALDGYFCPTWPPCADEWINRETNSGWPPKLLKKHIVEAGCLVVKRHHPRSTQPEYQWQFIFNEAEKILLLEGISSAQRYVYDVLKITIDYQTKHLTCKPRTIHIKSIFLFACEEINPTMFDESPGGCFLHAVSLFLEHMKRKHLPNYFVKENNMIDSICDEDAGKIIEAVEGLRLFPVQSLAFLSDSRGYQMAWLVNIVEGNYNQYYHEFDLHFTNVENFFPSMIRLSRKVAFDYKVDKASHILIQAHELLILSPPSKYGSLELIPNFKHFVLDALCPVDRCTKYMILNQIIKHTGISMFDSDNNSKKVKDFTDGKDIGGYGNMPIPQTIISSIYHEASFLHTLG